LNYPKAFLDIKSRYSSRLIILPLTFLVISYLRLPLFSFKQAVRKRQRRQREGFSNTFEVYPLNEFNSAKTEEEERKPSLRKLHVPSDEEAEDEDDEITPFYKPGYVQA